MKMVCFGDSVMWGQGLPMESKFNYQVFQALAGRPPQNGELLSFAHSGAVIGAGDDNVKPAIDPEVPDSYPTIFQQLAACSDEDCDADIVLIDGGINDVDAMKIVNPLSDTDDLIRATQRHCYGDMKELLVLASSRFDHAQTRIVVTGYYPIMSAQSDVDLLPRALGLRGVEISRWIHELDEMVYKKVFEHCKLFSDLSAQCFMRAVNEINQDEQANRVRYAPVAFAPENSELAPEAWLFGLNPDLSPQDPIQAARRAMCERDETDCLRRDACFHASLGHPNLIGVNKFAEAVLAALR